MPPSLAQQAMDKANLANQRVSGHEDKCTERWETLGRQRAADSKHADEQRKLLFEAMTVLSKRIWALVVGVGGWIITTLVAIVGWTLAHGIR